MIEKTTGTTSETLLAEDRERPPSWLRRTWRRLTGGCLRHDEPDDLDGAQATLDVLRGRFDDSVDQHADTTLPVYRSTQVGVCAEGTFAPDVWDDGTFRGLLVKESAEPRRVRLASGTALTAQIKRELEGGWDLVSLTPPTTPALPTVSGRQRMYQPFTAQKAILDETLVVTFSNAMGDKQVAVHVEDASDLVLHQLFVGVRNLFPCAPSPDSGVSGLVFGARSLGNDVDWPVGKGLDLNFSVAVKRTVLWRATPPEGYTSADITAVHVSATLNLMGPSR